MGVGHFVTSLVLFLALCTPQLVCGNAELRALMDLKAALDPENKLLRSWTSDGDPCSGSFDGVACNEHRKVANISLQGRGLSGKVSPAVAELKCLSGLYLHYNSLSGEIPKEIANLTELSDLYLNVNNLSGSIPSEIGDMSSLQVLQLCCNQLTGDIPFRMGSLKKLSVLSLQHNKLTGKIPSSLGNLRTLRRVYLSFNGLFGTIPATLANLPQLEVLDLRNNTLSGFVPSALQRLRGFQFENNPGLCGVGFSSLRACTTFDDSNIDQIEPFGKNINDSAPRHIPETASVQPSCNQTHCSNSSKLPKIAVVSGVVTVSIALIGAAFFTYFRYRRQKQKISSTLDSSDEQLSTDQVSEFYRNGASPLVALEYSNGWDPMGDARNGMGLSYEYRNEFRFNMEEVESATQCFSEVNLLGRSNFSSVYRGVLRDGSLVAIRSINMTSCRSEEAEFVKGLNLLTLLRHGNLVRLRGYCCSRARSECFLIYDFASNGNLAQYLDVEDGKSKILNWSTRVSIINGIAQGIKYLHSREGNKPSVVHRNISVEKVLIDEQFNPLIADCCLHKLLADDIIFSALKTSAAMGYLAPEYIITGRFTEKCDIFAFGVIIFQILSSKLRFTSAMRSAVESSRLNDLVDPNLKENFSEHEAGRLAKIALVCTHEHPDDRPTMEVVIEELSSCRAS